MRVGIVCPYGWSVPGGVQAHVQDLAVALRRLGHDVSVIAPADEDDPLPPYVVPAGRAVPVRYNGSVARLTFGLVSNTRVRRWLREGAFDVLHVHEPIVPSLSLLACYAADGPMVATFHAALPRSRWYRLMVPTLAPAVEKIRARIAVSDAARETIVRFLGGDAVLIPNGVDVAAFRDAVPLDGWPQPGGTLGFLGRFDEPRKGFEVLRDAFVALAEERPGLRLLVAGPGDVAEAVDAFPASVRDRLTFLGRVSDQDKARFLRSVDVYVAPNTGQESFGVILLEAAAAGAPIVASDIEAFRRVLDGGAAGELFRTGDAEDLRRAVSRMLDDRAHRDRLAARAGAMVCRYDWPAIAAGVVEVYETVTAGRSAGVAEHVPQAGEPEVSELP